MASVTESQCRCTFVDKEGKEHPCAFSVGWRGDSGVNGICSSCVGHYQDHEHVLADVRVTV